MYFKDGKDGSWIKDKEPESPAHNMSVLRQHSHSLLVKSGGDRGARPLVCSVGEKQGSTTHLHEAGNLTHCHPFRPDPHPH